MIRVVNVVGVDGAFLISHHYNKINQNIDQNDVIFSSATNNFRYVSSGRGLQNVKSDLRHRSYQGSKRQH
jgi:hypothetical protein